MNKKFFFLLLFALPVFGKKSFAQNFHFVPDDTIIVTINGDTLLYPFAGGINYPLFGQIDLNGDGLKDLFVFEKLGNVNEKRIVLFINKGTTGKIDYRYAPEYLPKFPHLHDWVLLYDYNCDGREDIFTLSDFYNGIKVYRNDFTVQTGLKFTLVSTELNSNFNPSVFNIYAGAVALPTFADVDTDGDMDILSWKTLPDGQVVFHQNLSEEMGYGCDSLIFQHASDCWGHFGLCVGGLNCVCSTGFSCREANPFENNSQNPFENYDPSDAALRDDTQSCMTAVNFDGDLDIDLLMGGFNENNFAFLKNTGSTSAAWVTNWDCSFPSYDTAVKCNSYPCAAYLDINNDGSKDLIAEANYGNNFTGNVWMYENLGTTSLANFSYRDSSFLVDNMIDVGQGSYPVFFDEDGDGLLDLFVGNEAYFQWSGTLKTGVAFFKNVGTSTNPSFVLVTRDYANISSLNLQAAAAPAFGDLDGDGDADMLIGSSDGKFQYYRNDGGTGNPANFVFAQANYYNLDVGLYSTPQIIDLDKDGLMDLVSGRRGGTIWYYRNIGTSATPAYTLWNDTLGCVIVNQSGYNTGYSAPYFFTDSIGNLKLLCGSESGYVFSYGNINTSQLAFACFTPMDTIIKQTEGGRVTINAADINGDGVLDIVVGIYSGGLRNFLGSDKPLHTYHPGHDYPSPVPASGNFPSEISTGINELSVKPSFLINPNPANFQLNIDFYHLSKQEAARFIIYNNTGQIVSENTFRENHLSINVSGFANGIYSAQLMSGGNSVSRKILIQH